METIFLDKIFDYSHKVVLNYMEMVFTTYPNHVKNPIFSLVIYKYLVTHILKYFNAIYKSLILKNDENLYEDFNLLIKSQSNGNKHNEICTINMISQITLSFIDDIMNGHHRINKSSLELYLKDIYMIINFITSTKKEILIKNLMTPKHICENKNLADCDPNKPLYEINTISAITTKDINLLQKKDDNKTTTT